LSFTSILKDLAVIVKEVALLQRPVTAAAVAGVIVAVIPGVNISAAAIAGILVGIGAAAAVVEKFVTKKPLTQTGPGK
jgi:F0F1-type ATP synthase assembly protein I